MEYLGDEHGIKVSQAGRACSTFFRHTPSAQGDTTAQSHQLSTRPQTLFTNIKMAPGLLLRDEPSSSSSSDVESSGTRTPLQGAPEPIAIIGMGGFIAL